MLTITFWFPSPSLHESRITDVHHYTHFTQYWGSNRNSGPRRPQVLSGTLKVGRTEFKAVPHSAFWDSADFSGFQGATPPRSWGTGVWRMGLGRGVYEAMWNRFIIPCDLVISVAGGKAEAWPWLPWVSPGSPSVPRVSCWQMAWEEWLWEQTELDKGAKQNLRGQPLNCFQFYFADDLRQPLINIPSPAPQGVKVTLLPTAEPATQL